MRPPPPLGRPRTMNHPAVGTMRAPKCRAKARGVGRLTARAAGGQPRVISTRRFLHPVPAALVAAVLLLAAWPGLASAAGDVGNCMVCHGNPGLAAIDEAGELRFFFVDEETYGGSVHARVACDGCHADVNQVPHETVEPVDCQRRCHITEPSRDKHFSHAPVGDALGLSVHSPTNPDGTAKEHPADYPGCKDCHDNPLFRPIGLDGASVPGISSRAIERCRACHDSEEFVSTFYAHMTSRLVGSRSPKNLAEVCGRCHNDPELGERHGLIPQVVVSYEATFHGKAAAYLDENVPSCLDCHAPQGVSVHRVTSQADPDSPIHPDNKGRVCAQADCHPSAAARAAEYDIHAQFSTGGNPILFWFTVFFYCIAGGTLLPLCGLILLDLLRRIFPNVVLVRRR